MLRYAFVGKMQSGKNLACEILMNKYGGENMSFAAPVYNIEEYIWNLLGIPIPTDKKVRRPILQIIGTEIGRDLIDKNVWLDFFQRDLGTKNFANVFVSDARFPNEVERLIKLGFKVIKIDRPDLDRREAAVSHEGHRSETSIELIPNSLYTATITNDGTLDEFKEKILRLVTQHELDYFCSHSWSEPEDDIITCSMCGKKAITQPGFLFAGIE